MKHEIPVLDNAGLRKFGFMMAAFIGVLFGLFFPWLLERATPTWPWIAGGLFAVPAILFPSGLNPVYKIWMKIGGVLGWINTRIILGLLFYALVFPMGMVMRLFGKDPMSRKLDKQVGSYRIKSKKAPKEDLENPY
jgi:hypothetical protein